jgi:hypothetical protein
MVTEKELKSAVILVLERYPAWRYSRGWIFHLAVGYYLRGIAFARSWSNDEIVKV